MTDAEKLFIYREVCDLYRSRYGEDHMARGSCLYWTNCGGAILNQMGIRALPQAGSLQWPVIPAHLDDGKRHTHFSYIWSPEHPASQFALAHGLMPEIHVWLGLPDTNEIVDFSTKHLKLRAELDGMEWTAPPPPDFLWTKADQLPQDVIYAPDMDAIGFVLNMIFKNEGKPLETYEQLTR